LRASEPANPVRQRGICTQPRSDDPNGVITDTDNNTVPKSTEVSETFLSKDTE